MDVLRLRVSPTPDPVDGGFQLEVFVNDREMTSAGAGMGMDPYDVLVPTCRLGAEAEARTVPIARCRCGDYGCGGTDVVISREAAVVHWDWLLQKPMDRRVTFAAEDYDAEVSRVAADHRWETPERTAGRLLLGDAPREALARHGLRLVWAAGDFRDPELFTVALRTDDDCQVFLRTGWAGRSPAQLAQDVRVLLASVPRKWTATWHPSRRGGGRPRVAGPRWRREEF